MSIAEVLYHPIDYSEFHLFDIWTLNNFKDFVDHLDLSSFMNVWSMNNFKDFMDDMANGLFHPLALFDSKNLSVFKQYMDGIDNIMITLINNIMMIFNKLLYFTRVRPVELINNHRASFCETLPRTETLDFSVLANNHPFTIVYCSLWFSHRLEALEKFIMLPYVLFQAMNDKFNQFFPLHHQVEAEENVIQLVQDQPLEAKEEVVQKVQDQPV